jgi:hypothetical protein
VIPITRTIVPIINQPSPAQGIRSAFGLGDLNAQGLAETKIGPFTQELYDEAAKAGWHVISMKNDWKVIFPWQPQLAPTGR